jgi:hypothetical protein
MGRRKHEDALDRLCRSWIDDIEEVKNESEHLL